jgi:hypothetical protein
MNFLSAVPYPFLNLRQAGKLRKGILKTGYLRLDQGVAVGVFLNQNASKLNGSLSDPAIYFMLNKLIRRLLLM